MVITSTVQFYGQDYDAIFAKKASSAFTGDWKLPRVLRAEIQIRHHKDDSFERIAEAAFHIFNAPSVLLDEFNQKQVKDYTGPSMSVGDLIRINRDGVRVAECLCLGLGWDIRSTKVSVVS